MTEQITKDLMREAAFIESYTQYYRRQLAAAAQALSGTDHTGKQCIDLCIEALQMIGDSKKAMIAALRPVTK